MNRVIPSWFALIFLSCGMLICCSAGAGGDTAGVNTAALPVVINALKNKDLPLDAGVRFTSPSARRAKIEVSQPGELNKSNTEYVLTKDVIADGTAFTITANAVTLNLNGHTIIYDDKSIGSDPKSVYGVIAPKFGQRDISIVNGTIRQGRGNGSGNVVGWGHNPIFCEGTEGLEIAGLTLEYSGKDIVGVFVHWGHDVRIYHNTFDDKGSEITNRHQGLDAIRIEGANAKIHHNLVKRCRHRAFTIASNTEVYSNDINIDSHATNSYGVMCFGISNFSVHDNKIIGVGEHPLGVGAVAKARNGKIYSNYIEMQNTRKSAEYGSTGSACVRLLWGSDEIEVYNNTLVVKAKNDYLPGFNSWGRAVWVGLPKPEMRANFHDNVIIANNSDGKAKAVGIAITNDAEPNPATLRIKNNLIFRNNTVVSNWSNILLSDSYGEASGFTRFIDNTIIRQGNFPSYKTLRSQYKYWPSTAVFIHNKFENGASLDNIDLEFAGSGLKEIVVGWQIEIVAIGEKRQRVKDAKVLIYDATGNLVYEGITGIKGSVSADLVEYVLTNQKNQGEKVSATKINGNGFRIENSPHRIMIYSDGYTNETKVKVDSNKVVEVGLKRI